MARRLQAIWEQSSYANRLSVSVFDVIIEMSGFLILHKVSEMHAWHSFRSLNSVEYRFRFPEYRIDFFQRSPRSLWIEEKDDRNECRTCDCVDDATRTFSPQRYGAGGGHLQVSVADVCETNRRDFNDQIIE